MGVTGTAILSAVATAVVSSALAPKPKAAPSPEPQKLMPVADDQAALMARKKAMAANAARAGRVSTVLTGDAGDKLGG